MFIASIILYKGRLDMKGGLVATLALVLSVLAAHASTGEGESAITKLVNLHGSTTAKGRRCM